MDVLEQLRQRKATGTLTVDSGDFKKCIFLKLGQIVFATSTSSQDRLGEVLVKTGKLTRENLEYATQLYKKNAGLKKLGAILVENRLLASKDLFGGLKAQVKDIIFSLILLDKGDFQLIHALRQVLYNIRIDGYRGGFGKENFQFRFGHIKGDSK